jgi:hypothetical protein
MLREMIEDYVQPTLRFAIDSEPFLKVSWACCAVVAVLHSTKGQSEVQAAYPIVYERIAREGTAVVPFTLRKADRFTMVGLMAAYTIAGCIFLQISWTIIGLCLASLTVYEIPRRILSVILVAWAADDLVVRAFLVPLADHLGAAHVLKAFELYFLFVCLTKGLGVRNFNFVCCYLVSFFHPHRCAFTSGDEGLDGCHKTFVTLVASQVQTDAQEMDSHKEHLVTAIERLNVRRSSYRATDNSSTEELSANVSMAARFRRVSSRGRGEQGSLAKATAALST